MFQYEIEVTVNKETFFETIQADNQREALEFAHLMYPEATYLELA